MITKNFDGRESAMAKKPARKAAKPLGKKQLKKTKGGITCNGIYGVQDNSSLTDKTSLQCNGT
jgi:hypothetical protein